MNFFYQNILRPLLFRLDAESAHNLAIHLLALTPPAILRTIFCKNLPSQPSEVFGLKFPNPVGLAAGMDKNAEALTAWESLGFGFVEIGTITAHAQPGNPKPRCFRYPAQQALINRMGFNNDGAIAVAARLERVRHSGRWPKIPVGINLGKSKITPLDDAPADYLASLRALKSFGDYFVINVSSPNTPGLRDLQEISRLAEIMTLLRIEVPDKPILVKIAPDLTDDAAVEIAALAEKSGMAGLISTNTTLDHSSVLSEGDQQGGLSGTPLLARSTNLTRRLVTSTSLPVIASGGIMDAASAHQKFEAGAKLIQLYTGFVYKGPGLIVEILKKTTSQPE